jgi:hypothetical protein
MSRLGEPVNAESPHRSRDRGALSYETAAGGTFTSYYVDDLTHSQTQGEITDTYALDASSPSAEPRPMFATQTARSSGADR